MWKLLRQNKSIQKTGSWLIAFLIRLLAHSIRWDKNIPFATKRLLDDNKPIILIFWHNRILSMTAGWDNSQNITLLRSSHRDGLLIANLRIAGDGIFTFYPFKDIAGS